MQKLVGFLVIQLEVIEVNLVTIDLANDPQTVINDSQVGQPQKVHLQQSHILDLGSRELSSDHTLLRHLQWNNINQRLRGNHSSTSMNAMTSDRTFQLSGKVINSLGRGISLILVLDIRVGLQDLPQSADMS